MRVVPVWLAFVAVLALSGSARAQVGAESGEATRRAYWTVSLVGGPIVPRVEEAPDEGLALALRAGYTSRFVFGAVADVRGALMRRDDGDHAHFAVSALPRLTLGSPSARIWFGIGVGALFEEGRGAAASVESRARIDLVFLGQGGISLGATHCLSFLGEHQWDYFMFDMGMLLDL